jgi:hypothetical protein
MKLTKLNVTSRPTIEPRPRRLPYTVGHIAIYLGLLLVLLVAAWLVIKTVAVGWAYQQAESHAAALESMLTAPQPEQLTAELRGLTAAIEQLADGLLPLLPPPGLAGHLPVIGPDIEALPLLLAAARDLGQAGLLALALTEADTLQQSVERLALVQSDLAQINATLRGHLTALAQIDTDSLSPPLARRSRQLQRQLTRAQHGLQLAAILPQVLGFDAPQTYLILMQNADELRPSGGYITTAGHVVIDRGNVIDFLMQDSYAVDNLSEAYPYPPAPLREYMKADYWVLRDASWSPDFPEAARTALTLYELGQGVQAGSSWLS